MKQKMKAVFLYDIVTFQQICEYLFTFNMGPLLIVRKT